MKKNMGTADRIIRIILAVVMIGLFLTDAITGTWAYVLMAAAIIFLLTSVISFCPLYLPFGIKTCKEKQS
ncbi:YgaP family membrane protein [Aurantibacillus circumpalustris]|uniref:YgaP family membrane protein n=1 Tax=Aurantibacillus circumpalustris TaxID=3036359 RepID=UPI00295A69D8|nr:DUF2892 domain-containing protein [Aurantibacillus circumpalustris]